MNRDRFFFLVQSLVKNISLECFNKIRPLLYRYFFRNIGEGVRIMDCVTFKYPSRISIGDKVTINEYSYINGCGGLEIGDHCLIGSGAKLTSSTHIYKSPNTTIMDQGLETSPVTIGSDVFLGFDVKILPGVVVGNGCVLGAGAVLPKGHFAPYSVISGVPAKVIKKRV